MLSANRLASMTLTTIRQSPSWLLIKDISSNFYTTLTDGLKSLVGLLNMTLTQYSLYVNIFSLTNNIGFSALNLVSTILKKKYQLLNAILRKCNVYLSPNRPYPYILLILLAISPLIGPTITKYVTDFIPTDIGKELNPTRAVQKQVFREQNITKPHVNKHQLHPEQRRFRQAAINMTTEFCHLTGQRIYNIQPRPSQKDSDYDLNHHWITDTDLKSKHDIVQPDHVIVRVDSDYYENMNHVIPQNFNTHLIYHHSPITASSPKTDDYPSHTFVKNKLIVDDNGAVHYENYIWNYGVENVSYFNLHFPTWNEPYLFSYRSYQIDSRRVSKTHAITAVIPRLQYKGICAIMGYLAFGETQLKIVTNGVEDFTVMRIIGEDSDTISISNQGEYSSVELPIGELSHLQWLHESAKMPITLPKIKTKTGLNSQKAAMVQNYVHSVTKRNIQELYKNYKVEYGVKTYQMYPNSADNNPRPSMIPFMFPVVNGAFSPARATSSEVASIEGRLTKLQQHKPITPRHYKYINAFLKRLIPKPHLEHPLTDDDVFEKQPRPSQQQILECAIQEDMSTPFSNTHVKKEAYGKIADPRIITTSRPADKLERSKYEYTSAKFLKLQPWYMFGKTPAKIANKIVKIATSARKHVNCTDFSRMDGRKTIITRTLDVMYHLRLFAREHHKNIISQGKRKIDSRACTSAFDGDEEFHFSTLLAQDSGSPDTSNDNSLDNAFINFVGFCNMLSSEPDEETFDRAFELLQTNCAIAGDDTAAGDLDDTPIKRAASWCGHVLTSDIFVRGDTGVNFLARIYGDDVWNGCPNSCTDIMRCLAKLHTTTHIDPKITPMEKLGQKLTSLWYTDENTPIIRNLIKAYQGAGGLIANREGHFLRTYWSQYDKDVQYPNMEASYMWELLPECNMEAFCDVLHDIETCKRPLEDILELPLLFDVEVKPHNQQTVLENDGVQELVGEDNTRIEQPQEQNVTVPSIPNIMPIKISKLLCKNKDVKMYIGRKGKRRRRQYRVVPSAVDALDMVFCNQGMGLSRGKVIGAKPTK